MSLRSYPTTMSELGDAAGPGPGSSSTGTSQPSPAWSGSRRQQQSLTATAMLQHDPLRMYKVFLSGALSGAISRTATAPVDRLKMLLQTHEEATGLSLRQGWQKMLAEGSIKSFFKGNGANVVKIAPETALKLTLNDSIRSVVAKDPDHVLIGERMVSGGIAGAIAQGLLYPLDTIRTRLAVSAPNTYAGILHAAYRIRRDEGARAFYRGITPSMIGILPFAGMDIALFEVFKDGMYERYDGRPPNMGIVVAGMLSSSIAQ
ncbi:Calcium-binding mitochondrial carrier protein SCaMC-2-A, partial [Tetrabaena socialis]